MNVYLDNSATTPLSNDTKDYLIKLLDIYGNPSSHNSLGEKAKKVLSDTRKKVANFINSDPSNIYFTCSGSASNTLGVKGFISKYNCNIFYSPIVHKSISKIMDDVSATALTVDACGLIDLNDLERKIVGTKPFVIIDYANSEIGTIQDIKKIIDIVHFYKGIIYLDCTGSIPTIPLDVKFLDVDICGFSSHKLGALKGCGVLYKKYNIQLEPIIYGTQENGLIGGTENVLSIASLGKVIESYDYTSVSHVYRDFIYNYIITNIPNSYLVGASIESGNRLPHNLYICFRGIESESLMILLDMNGIQVSTGSACSSGSLSPSDTLLSIGMYEHDLHSCIRITLSGNETKTEIDYTCKKIKQCVETLRDINKNIII